MSEVASMLTIRRLDVQIDVDSVKWTNYASAHRWPLAMLYRREGQRLLVCEREVASQSRRSYFVTPNETALFVSQTPECRDKVQTIEQWRRCRLLLARPAAIQPLPTRPTGRGLHRCHGLLAQHRWSSLGRGREAPAPEGLLAARTVLHRGPQSVRAGAGIGWRARGGHRHGARRVALPAARRRRGGAVVAPLRVARGIQNKILESMAMQHAVITVNSCADVIGATAGQGLLRAETPEAFVEALVDTPGHAAELTDRARAYVEQGFSWQAYISGIDQCLGSLPAADAANPAEAALHG